MAEERGLEFFEISSVTGLGIDRLINALGQRVRQKRAAEPEIIGDL
jgi:hypothetical protein